MILSSHTPRWVRVSLVVTFVLSMMIGIGVMLLQAAGMNPFGPIRTGRIPTAEDRAARAATLPRLYVPNPIIESMVRALTGEGDRYTLYTPWRDDATGEPKGDPAYWKPTADEVRAIQACELIYLNGAGYEPWSAQAALPRAKTVDTTADLASRLIVEKGETHSHGPEGEHSHSGFASSTWLSPALAKEQLATVVGRLYEVLGSTYPTGEIFQSMCKRLDEASANLREIGKLQPKLLASHPVYQYLGQAGGIAIDSMHWEPGEMPSDKEWTKFRLTRAAHPRPTAWMLWEGEPGPEIRAKLEAEGVNVFIVPLFPIDAAGASGDDLHRDVDREFVWYYPELIAEFRAALEKSVGSEGSVPSGK
jgi:ABC-type Zn uptake system ZnuABC Zn-binding protein ZnuA